jgi:hypothetical protein
MNWRIDSKYAELHCVLAVMQMTGLDGRMYYFTKLNDMGAANAHRYYHS